VLYDIDIGFREYGSQIGIEVSRPESLNDSATFIAALADLVKGRNRKASVAQAPTPV
jgi:protoheme ferro-lyase